MTQEQQAIEYSRHLGPVSSEQIQAALDRFDLGKLLHVRPVQQGVNGQTLFINSTAGAWVFRGKPHFPGQFERERFFTDLLHTHTQAPVPWPYRVESTADLFGWAFVIMPRMPGMQFGYGKVQARLSDEDWRGIARACGEVLAELHQLQWPPWPEHPFPFPVVAGDAGVSPQAYAASYLAKITEALENARQLSPKLDEADIAWLQQQIETNQAALLVPFRPCFVMEDFKDGNLTISRAGGHWRVSGVFDYMFAQFGDGETDLSRSIANFAGRDIELARIFLHAYQQRRPLRAGYRERYRLYMLCERFGLWVWAQSQGQNWGTLREMFGSLLSLDLFE